MQGGGAVEEKIALVAGVTGIVGLKVAERLLLKGQGGQRWRVYGVARRPKPTWLQEDATYIQCDLLDREQTMAALSPLACHVTHLFFTTWTSRDTEEENVEANAAMLRNTLDALLLATAHSALQHVCLQTGCKHYLGSFNSPHLHNHLTIRTFSEDTPRLPEPNFYYAQEDVLLEAAASRALTWSVHRPPIILGASASSTLFQMPFCLAAYACVCKHDKERPPFIFTGSAQIWDGPVEAADAELVAEQEIWAATHTAGHNQAFNVSHGDVIKWRDLWPAVAAFFNVQAAPYAGEPRSVVQMLQSKAHVWERIVSQYKLQPTAWEDVIRGWWGLDWCMHSLPPYHLSTAKSARLGFVGSHSDTKASLLANFQNLQSMAIIPRE